MILEQGFLGKIAGHYQSVWVRAAHAVIAFNAFNGVTSQYSGEPLYHVSGFLAMAVGKAIDHASTVPLIRLVNTPEFSEKGLKGKYQENNPFTGSHPTMSQYIKRAVPQDLFFLTLGAIFPALGYTYLSAAPIFYKNNQDIRQEIESSLEEVLEETLECNIEKTL